MKRLCIYVTTFVLASVFMSGAAAQDDSCFTFDRGGRSKIISYDSSCTKRVVIPEGTTSIGSYAFDDQALESVSLPWSLTEIGRNAFSRNRLTGLTLPGQVASVGDSAFRNNLLTDLVILNPSASIGRRAFDNNPHLTSVCIENSGGETLQIPINTFGGQAVVSIQENC